MRKAQKQRLLDLVSTLYEAHKVIEENLNNSNVEMTKILLADCQDAAVQMGNMIEQSEGAGSFTVHLLEDYCEVLFRIYEDIAAYKNSDRTGISLDQALLRVGNSMEEDIKVHLEVVFLPYKASMWDSLESVWKAAEADPDCDAYVVPIPYYDMNPDQSLGEMHYEGDQYPSYVPVVNWKDYPLEERCPDIVFIHNPYDDRNLVTRIHNRYFSKNLRKHTEILCYIPYFAVTTSISPSFALLPAVLYSDFIIVQSEEIRQQYLSVWARIVQEKETDFAIFETIQRKILALGSPKLDFAANMEDNDSDLPETWKHLMAKSDGTRKKIVFYNTSLSSMLKKSGYGNDGISDLYLQKVESVLDIFKKTDDAVLWWRPHPLMKSTFAAMRPELYQRYIQIVDTYQKEGYGIYDDSPDLHRAVRTCDLYYGDSSSVMALMQAVGKTILVQNINLTDYVKCLDTNVFLYDGEYVWCAAAWFNGLFRLGLNECGLKYIGMFPNETPEKHNLFSNALAHNGKIYFCPYHAKNIAVYDKGNDTFSSIPLKESIRDMDGKFSSILVHGGYIYMQGYNIPSILRMNTETNEIFYMDDWAKDIERHPLGKPGCYIRRGCVHKGNLYYFSPFQKGLLCIHTKDLSSEWIPLACHTAGGFANILSDGEVLWLLPEDTEDADCFISCFDPETSELLELEKIGRASSFCYVGGYIYYFSRSQPYLYRIDKKTKQIVRFPVEGEIYECCPMEDKILMMAYLTGELYIFDTVQLTTSKIRLRLGEENTPPLDYPKLIEESLKIDKLVLESGTIHLNDLLEMSTVSFEKGIPSACQTNREPGRSGIRIYEYMAKKVLL